MNNNYQLGGWYQGRQWDGTKLGPVGQVIVGSNASSGSTAPDFTQDDNKVNDYVNQLVNQAKGNHDLAIQQLDAQHKLALGNDNTEQAKFLEQVANSLENQIGRIPYDYQKYTGRENQNYGIQNQSISENRSNAMAKLQNDEQALGQNEYKTNQDTAESLNQRGLLAGQAPVNTGSMNSTTFSPLTGLSGLAGQQAGLTNDSFNNQFQGLGIQGQGINNQFNQQQRSTDFAHQNSLTDLTDNARRDAQDAGNQYTFGTKQADLTQTAATNDLEQQRQALLRANRSTNAALGGIKNGIYGY